MVTFGSKLLLVVILLKSHMHPTYHVSTGPPINTTILLSILLLHPAECCCSNGDHDVP